MQSTTGFRALCAMTFTAAWLLVMPGTYAQSQTSSTLPSTSPRPRIAPTNISDNKLDAAAAVAKRVSAIADTYEQKLAQAPAAEKERLVGEADYAIEKAVTDQGLSVEEYMTIMKVAQDDPIVRYKLSQRLK